MENVNLGRLATFDELNSVNKDLTNIYKELQKQTKDLEKPSGIADRLFVDLFGVGAMYLLLFFTCDITRSIVLDEEMFGIKWLFFGPYYFFTNAPIMTRLWKSKKFLEDLSDAKKNGIEYDPQKTCTQEGRIYELACDREDNHPHQHPIRDNLGKGLDWVLRHTVGKHLGGLLGNATCQDQAETIARDCADNRLTRAWDCYLFLCEQHGVIHVAPSIDWPNTSDTASAQTHGWDSRSQQAYQAYYDVYLALYDVGMTSIGTNSRPSNLNPEFDATNAYTINGLTIFSYPVREDPPSGFGTPPWWRAEDGWAQDKTYYQDNYTNHLLDYWDPVA